MCYVVVPKLECAGEVWEGNAKLVKQLETAAEKYYSRRLKHDK